MNSRRLKKVLAIDKVLLREKVCSEVFCPFPEEEAGDFLCPVAQGYP